MGMLLNSFGTFGDTPLPGASGIDADTVLMLKMNGADASTTFTDSSDSAHTMTAVGSAQIDTAQSKFDGASGLFGGSGDYLSTAISADFAFASGDFCIDAQVRLSTFGAYHIIIGCGYTSNWMWQLQTDGNLKLWIAGGSGLTFIHGMTTDAWHHICVARLSGVIYGYVDGVYKASNSYASSIGGSLALYVGNDPQVSGAYAGHIDELRVSKGAARIDDSADLLYCGGTPTNGFTPPSKPYTDER